MSKIKELIKSPHIQIALTTGFCIIVMAYFSKRFLPQPIGYLSLAIPPFIATLFEAVIAKYEHLRICNTRYWVVAILAATTVIILVHT